MTPSAQVTTTFAKTACRQCGGEGTVLVDSSDRRKGETTCGSCSGTGEH